MYQVLVIGLGSFGISLVEEFLAKKSEVVVIENSQEKAQQVKDLVQKVVVADATSKDVLCRFARDVDCVLVCLGEKMDSSILVTHLLKELGVKRIIAKAISPEHGQILELVGANEIVFPERDTAKRLVTSLTSPDVLDFLKLSNNYDIMEIAVPDTFAGKTIREAQLRNKYGIEIIAIRNPLTGKTQIMPSPDYNLQPDDVLVALGEVESFQKIK